MSIEFAYSPRVPLPPRFLSGESVWWTLLLQEVASLDTKVAQDKPSKEEYAVAKWIRNNVPSKKTKFDRTHNVEYFTGSRAIDALLENSPWSTVFENREQVSQFLDLMLRHKFFHRAKKVVISEEELNKMRGIKKKPTKDAKEDKKATDKEDKDSKENKDAAVVKDEKSEEKTDERKEHKKKPKVSMKVYSWYSGEILVC